MNIFSKINLIIFLIISIAFEVIYCQNADIPKVKVKIEKKVLQYLEKISKEKFEIINKIDRRLKDDFNAAWEACEKKIASLPDCYKNAFNEYKEMLKYGYDNKFVIHFDFHKDFVKYHRLKGIDFSKENFPGNHSGNSRIGPDPYNEITIYNVYAEKWFLRKYFKKSEYCSYEYVLSEVNKYLCEKGKKIRVDYFLLHWYNWSISDKAYLSIKNMIIHELFHIVLYWSSHKDLQSRFADEATISDTVFKISPLPQGEKGAYEYYYEFISWLLDNQHTIKIPSILINIYVRITFYTEEMNRINRKFNPPLDLEYDKKGYTLNGYCTYIPVSGEITKADDCRCNKMQKYVIPRKCCK
jgi:hypothetical protein